MNNLFQLAQSVLNNQQMINSNPMLKNAVGLYRSNDTSGLKSLAENLCKERGIDINNLMNQLGMK